MKSETTSSTASIIIPSTGIMLLFSFTNSPDLAVESKPPFKKYSEQVYLFVYLRTLILVCFSCTFCKTTVCTEEISLEGQSHLYLIELQRLEAITALDNQSTEFAVPTWDNERKALSVSFLHYILYLSHVM